MIYILHQDSEHGLLLKSFREPSEIDKQLIVWHYAVAADYKACVKPHYNSESYPGLTREQGEENECLY